MKFVALNLLESLEGLRLSAYQDEAGIWTIGYGHTGKDVGPGTIWTQDYADEALLRDLDHFIGGVVALVKVPLNDNQFSALVIFAYNVGLQALAGSTLLRHVNGRLNSFAATDFAAWSHIHKNGQLVVDPGLQKRRAAEAALFNS